LPWTRSTVPVRVNSRGFISLPLIGLVQAAGLTSEQLETSLAEKLAEKYLQNPQVSVFIKEYTSQRVTVEGAVKKPGIYPLRGRTSLLQTLAAAEGLTTVADPNGVRVFRTDPKTGNRATLEFDLEKIRAGEARDPTVQNDDIVQVGESQGKSVAKELIEFILPFRVLTY
jgi:polysaccharide export outer membrane protein